MQNSRVKKAQSWSMEFIIATSIFLILVIVIYTMVSATKDKSVSNLQQEAELILRQTEVPSSPVYFISEGKVSTTELKRVIAADKETLKKNLGIKDDFCIFFEDAQGKVIYVADAQNNEVRGVGSPEILIGGQPCR